MGWEEEASSSIKNNDLLVDNGNYRNLDKTKLTANKIA
jgi:hypothetical protein